MKQKGIKSRDIVMGSSDNHLDACVPILAALFLGAIPCPMDPCIAPTEVIHIIDQVKPKLIFTIPSSLKLIKEACHELNVDIEIVVFGSPEFRFFTERQNGEDGFEPVISQDPKETAVIYFSSGTTGLAKACCLSHAYFIKQSSLVPSDIAEENLDLERRNFEWLKFKNDGTFLSYCPLYWLTAGKIIFEMFIVGGTCVLGKKFDSDQFWHIVDKFRVCLVMLSPFAISELAKYGKPPNFNADSLVKILTGGAVSQTKYWKLLQDILPDIDILQNYGLTETGVIAYYEAYNKVHREHYMTHPESIGFPVRGVWYKVVDPQTEKVLGPNQEGELYVKSEFFTNGYYNQPYDDVFDTDGWFRTGDVVYYTDNCALYFTNRLKELMKYRQLTVYPYVLEKELLKHPAVAQAAVLGIPHEDDGDHPAAFVVLKSDSGNVKAEEIRKFVDERVQDKAKLRGGVRVVDSFPTTSTGKLKRVQLRKMVLEE
ncbi:4-coumarate--CoA ligase 1 isoform X2 [Anoplophora glabripennis]|nr:4-coumarate--CoA ligase 1 isoform X2 [Anoplophora glabripennis]